MLMSVTAYLVLAAFLVVLRTALWPTTTLQEPAMRYIGAASQPQQVHLSWAIDRDDAMIVTWTTDHPTMTSTVVLRPESGLDPRSVSGNASALVADDVRRSMMGRRIWSSLYGASRTSYVHRVVLCDLVPSQVYLYRAGDAQAGWSSLFRFRFKPEPTTTSSPITFVVYGDLGDVNSRSLPMIQAMVEEGQIDAILHVGDFAYDLGDDFGRVGDRFMKDIEGIAASVPYMTCPGNHEYAEDFKQYRARFSRGFDLAGSSRMWYSFDRLNIHFVSLSTEVYWFGTEDDQRAQYDWLVDDLAAANAARAGLPWIVTFGHRPPYCSNDNNDDCTLRDSVVRTGIVQPDGTRALGLERPLVEAGVDLAIWAHEHSYERLWPTINNVVVQNGAMAYSSPTAPTHVNTGSAGCKEGQDGFAEPTPPWSAARLTDYGFSIVRIVNDTHLHWQQISTDLGGGVADEFWLTQTRHGPFVV